ncbi:nucleotidyltransferase [Candidatus Bathyarchaeota archaeon]|nr:nucleotidyltransferase [Candidatus Bathyarchaeota archaeon]MBL7078981.1 nucleotidyltransferase [Candidatus Bathyarchaeota archaeon]
MSEIAETLDRLVSFLEDQGIDYMLIGGYVLPMYGRIRTTLDIDVAAALTTEESFTRFLEGTERADYGVSLGSFQNPVCLLHDRLTDYEIEIWRQPDGVVWDDETLRRRRKATLAGVEVWMVSPEDYIVTKLARSDRGVIDEQDVKSVLEREDVTLDWPYLRERAGRAGVWAQLHMIRNV